MRISNCLQIASPAPGYAVHISTGLLANADVFRESVANKPVFILTQTNIAPLYLSQLEKTCWEAGAHKVDSMLIPQGERHKSIETATAVWQRCLSLNLHRDAVLIALGGGVIGDLGGFCAACFHRGIAFMQCPTSLVAQIDASVGGKTAVNLSGVKNAIGCFYPPQMVMIDPNTLKTLPDREYRAGLAELVKYGLGFDSDFFDWIEKNTALLLNKDPKALHHAIYRACALKAAVVQQDCYDNHERLRLNLGHTIGHALEGLVNDDTLRHGEAVAVGLVAVARIALKRGDLDEHTLARVIRILRTFGLPIHCPSAVTDKAICQQIRFDKKHLTHQTRWVLLRGVGQSYIAQDVTDDEIRAVLAQMVCVREEG